MGFDGTPWHTHGDLLAAAASQALEDAVESFVKKLTGSELIIAVSYVDGKIRDIKITENPTSDLRYCLPDERIEFRLWDGTKILP